MLEVFDVICKYIVRCDITLKYPDAPVIPSIIVEYAKYWRENIRGKISLDVFSTSTDNTQNNDTIQKGKEILDYLKKNYTITSLYKIFESIYGEIGNNFKLNDDSAKLVIAKVKAAIGSDKSTIITRQIEELSYDMNLFDINSILN
jgi:hypothetical protein